MSLVGFGFLMAFLKRFEIRSLLDILDKSSKKIYCMLRMNTACNLGWAFIAKSQNNPDSLIFFERRDFPTNTYDAVTQAFYCELKHIWNNVSSIVNLSFWDMDSQLSRWTFSYVLSSHNGRCSLEDSYRKNFAIRTASPFRLRSQFEW